MVIKPKRHGLSLHTEKFRKAAKLTHRMQGTNNRVAFLEMDQNLRMVSSTREPVT